MSTLLTTRSDVVAAWTDPHSTDLLQMILVAQHLTAVLGSTDDGISVRRQIYIVFSFRKPFYVFSTTQPGDIHAMDIHAMDTHAGTTTTYAMWSMCKDTI